MDDRDDLSRAMEAHVRNNRVTHIAMNDKTVGIYRQWRAHNEATNTPGALTTHMDHAIHKHTIPAQSEHNLQEMPDHDPFVEELFDWTSVLPMLLIAGVLYWTITHKRADFFSSL